MKKTHVFILFLLAATKTNYAICAINDLPIYEDSDIKVELDTLNTYQKNNQIFGYKADNQKLQLNFKISNKSQSALMKFNICSTETCSFETDDFDRKYIVSWYKDSNATKLALPGKKSPIVIPELLLNDPTLIIPIHARHDNAIRTNIKGKTVYITSNEYEKITTANKQGRQEHPAAEYEVTDSTNFMPIKIDNEVNIITKQKENIDKSVFIKIELNNKTKSFEIPIRTFNYTISGNLTNGIFYRGILTKEKPTLSSEKKDFKQLSQELNDIYEKGLEYPTLYESKDYKSNIATRNSINFKKDKLFIVDSTMIHFAKNNDWQNYQRRMKNILNILDTAKYEKTYFYLIDEPEPEIYKNLITKASPIAKSLNAGLFLAGRKDKILDPIVEETIYVVAYEPSQKIAEQVHKNNALILSYANPQIGVYIPAEMRLNYGFKIVVNSYDGIMPYAYQDSRGSPWSDFDGKFRDHMLTFPSSNSLIQTTHGLSIENAIIDQKYLETWQYWMNDLKKHCKPTYNSNIRLTDITPQNLDKTRFLLAQSIEEMMTLKSQCN